MIHRQGVHSNATLAREQHLLVENFADIPARKHSIAISLLPAHFFGTLSYASVVWTFLQG